MLKQYSTTSETLNSHVFGNIPLIKGFNFDSQKAKPLFKPYFQLITNQNNEIGSPNVEKNKKDVYLLQLEKLRVMLHFYSRD